jgi:hypothetical protein
MYSKLLSQDFRNIEIVDQLSTYWSCNVGKETFLFPDQLKTVQAETEREINREREREIKKEKQKKIHIFFVIPKFPEKFIYQESRK